MATWIVHFKVVQGPLTYLGSFQSMKILGQSKVKSFVRKLPCHIKIAETSKYAILAMKGPEVAFKIMLTSHRVNNRALKIKNHEKDELA